MSGTQFDAMFADARVQQGKRQLLSTLAEYQERLKGVRPPVGELRESYNDLLQRWGDLRGSGLFYPYIGSGLGRGPLVELADGSVKYDFIIGIGVHFFGHGHPLLTEAALDAALQNTVMQGNLQQNRISEEFARLLLEGANRKAHALDHVFLSTSGAMANENAVKIIFQKKFPADRLLAFAGGFAGRTMAMSQVSDKPTYREGLPSSIAVDFVPFYDQSRPEASTAEALAALRALLKRYPCQHAGMVFELVRGEGGFYPGSPEFFRTLMNELRANNIAVFIDEVQTFGRTPELFAYQYFGLEEFADVVSIGKLTQACATLFKDEYKPRPGLLSQTFTGATSALYTGTAVLRELQNGTYYGATGKIQKLHDHFAQRLDEIGARTGKVKGPFGVGAMIAATILDGSMDATRAFVKRLFEAGVIAFTAGANPARMRFLLPAGAVTETDIDEVCKIIETTLGEF